MTYCSKCGAPLAPDAQFCAKCGTPAAEAAAAIPDAPSVPAAPVVPPPPAAATDAPPPSSATTDAPPPPRSPRHVTMPPREMPSAAPAPPVQTKRSTWWIVPAVIIGLVLVAWLLLAGLPFGRDEQRTNNDTAAVDTIAEGTAPATTTQQTGTVIELPGDEPISTQTIAPPPLDTTGTITLGTPATATTTQQPPATATQPPPMQQQPRVVEEAPRPVTSTPTPTPRPSTPTPRPATPTPRPITPTPRPITPAPRPATPSPSPSPAVVGGEISDAEATNTLRGYITSRSYYRGVEPNCVEIRSQGYRNVGYGFAVWDTCVAGGGSRLLGRWRVDSKTREVFVQRSDGRFLRP